MKFTIDRPIKGPEIDVIDFVCLAWLVSLCVFAMYINYDFNKLN